MKILIFGPALFLITCCGNSSKELENTEIVKTIQTDTAIQIAPADTLILHKADSIYLFSDFKNDKLVFGYKNRDGKTIIKPQFEYAGEFYNGIAPVIKGHKHGLCDTSGNMIHVFADYEHVLYHNELGAIYEFSGISEGMFLVTNHSKKHGCVNTKNELVVPIIYDEIRSFSEGLAPFLKDGKYGYLDNLGNIAIQPTYEYVDAFHEGMAAVGLNDKTGFIDRNGNLIIEPKFECVSYFSEGLCAVSTNPDWGDFYYIDQRGKIIISGPFEEADPFQSGEAYIQKRGVCRVIDKTGKELRKVEGDCFARC
jgi:hypothetical protein